MAITVEMRTQVSQLYVSLFGRAPDSEGLGFWVSALGGGMTMAQIAESMYNTAPARTYYPAFATNQEIVATFYQNVLGRPADAEGLAFWTAELAKAPSKGAFFTKLLSNVVNYTGTNADGLKSQALFLNKVAVAQFYGETNGKIDGATAALNGVTDLPASVDAAKAAITVGTGQTFILTTGQDNVIGTGANDTIRGIYAGEDFFSDSGATATVGDVVDGGAGNDVLELTAQYSGLTEPGFVVKNVETITIRDLVGATFDAYSVENAPTINFIQTVAGEKSAVENAALASRFGLSGKGNMTINYAASSGAADTSNIALATAGTSAKIRSEVDVESHDSLDVDTIESVNIATSGTNFVTLAAGTAAGTVTITGNGTNDMVVSTIKTTSTIDASASTGTNTIDIGTQLSNKDVFKGGTGADTVKFNTTAAIGAVVFTGVETLAADFDVNSTLNLDGSTGVTTVTVSGSKADAVISNASAELKTLNIKSAGDTNNDITLTYKEDVVGALVVNLGDTAATATSLTTHDLAFVGTETLALNAIGIKDMTVVDVHIDAASPVKFTSNVVEEGSLNIGQDTVDDQSSAFTSGGVFADGFESIDITVGASGHFSAAEFEANKTGFGDITLTLGENALAWINEIDANVGGIGNVTLNVGEYGSGVLDDVGTSGSASAGEAGDIGNLELNIALGANAYIDAYSYSGNIGDITMSVAGKASGYVSAYASGYHGSGATASAYTDGGNIGNITVNIDGDDASGYVYATTSGGDVGNIEIAVDGKDSSAYVFVSADGHYDDDNNFNAKGANVGDINVTISDNAYASAYLDADGSIGNISFEAGDKTSGYVSAYSEYGSIGSTVVAMGDDAAFAGFYSADDGIGSIDITMGNDANNGWSGGVYAGVELRVWNADHIDAVNITVGAGSDVNVIYGYVEDNYSAGHIHSADGVTIAGGASGDTAHFETDISGGSGNSGGSGHESGGAVGSIDFVNMANWNGDYLIDLTFVIDGTTIYAGKNGGDIIGSQGVDVIYLGAGSDHVNIVAETNGNDMVYGFKAGAKGDLIEFNSNFTNFDFMDDFQSGIYSGASESSGLQDFIFSDLDLAVAKLEGNTSANLADYSYMFMVDTGNDVVVYFADYYNDALVHKAVATLVGVNGSDLTVDNFSLTAIPNI